MKSLLLLLVLFISYSGFSQVKFVEQSLQNGFKYPKVLVQEKPKAQAKINQHIETKIHKYKEMDFCIGQYGYVTKSGYLQIHIYANGIDMVESENNYYLYDLISGETCTASAMFKEDASIKLQKFIQGKYEEYTASNETSEKLDINTVDLDTFTTILTKDGLKLYHDSFTNQDKPIFIKWVDVQRFFRMNMI